MPALRRPEGGGKSEAPAERGQCRGGTRMQRDRPPNADDPAGEGGDGDDVAVEGASNGPRGEAWLRLECGSLLCSRRANGRAGAHHEDTKEESRHANGRSGAHREHAKEEGGKHSNDDKDAGSKSNDSLSSSGDSGDESSSDV